MRKRAAVELTLALAALLALAVPAAGQSQTGCSAAKTQPGHASSGHAATPPDPGDASGTNPGSTGSTGWSGGLGGSNIGTSEHAPTPGSEQQHPKTAQGTNPVPTPAARPGTPKPDC